MKIKTNILLVFATAFLCLTIADAAVLKKTIQGTISAFSKTSVTLIGEDGVKFDIPRSFLTKDQPVIGSQFRMELNDKDSEELAKFNKSKKQ